MGSSVYDQFSPFRSKTFEFYQPRCRRLADFSLADKRDPLNSVQSMSCEDMGTVVLLLELDGTQFKLKKLFGVPFVTDSGILPLRSSDQFATLFVDLTNLGEEPGIFELQPKSCCLVQNQAPGQCVAFSIDNANVVQRLVDPHDTKRFNFLLSAGVVADQTGACDFDLVQHGVLEASIRVEFVATLIDPKDPGGSSDLPSLLDPVDPNAPTSCQPPSKIVTYQGMLMCQSPCTRDQTLGQSGQCTPQDCTLKYGGSRNYYNQISGLCEGVALCVGNRILNTTSNTCTDPNAPPPNSGSPPSIPSFSPAPAPPSLYNPTTNGTINCGTHGKPSQSGKSCVCDSGWSTNANQDMFEFVWCSNPTVPSVIPPGTNTTSPQDGTGGGSTSFLSRLFSGNNKYVLIGVVVAIVLLCLCCSGVLFYFRRRLPCYRSLMQSFRRLGSKSRPPSLFSERPELFRQLRQPFPVDDPYVLSRPL